MHDVLGSRAAALEVLAPLLATGCPWRPRLQRLRRVQGRAVTPATLSGTTSRRPRPARGATASGPRRAAPHRRRPGRGPSRPCSRTRATTRGVAGRCVPPRCYAASRVDHALEGATFRPTTFFFNVSKPARRSRPWRGDPRGARAAGDVVWGVDDDIGPPHSQDELVAELPGGRPPGRRPPSASPGPRRPRGSPHRAPAAPRPRSSCSTPRGRTSGASSSTASPRRGARARRSRTGSCGPSRAPWCPRACPSSSTRSRSARSRTSEA